MSLGFMQIHKSDNPRALKKKKDAFTYFKAKLQRQGGTVCPPHVPTCFPILFFIFLSCILGLPTVSNPTAFVSIMITFPLR